MTNAAEDVLALRRMADELGLRPPAPPGPDAEGLDDGVDASWVEAMLTRVTGRDRPTSVVVPLRRRRARPALWLAAACAAALAVIGGPVVLQPPSASALPSVLSFSQVDPASFGPASGVPARRTLLDIAESARAEPPSPRAPTESSQQVTSDQWRLEIAVGAEGEIDLTIRPTRDESWLLPDGRLRVREVQTAPSFDESGQVTGEQDLGSVARDEVTPADARGPRWAEELPRDADELARQWLAGTGRGVIGPTAPSVVLTGRIADLYDRWVVDPDLAATVWTMLAEQPDVRDLGTVSDRTGRPGRAFGIWDEQNQTLEVLIVDESSGALLGREGILFDHPGLDTREDLQAPLVGYFVTYLSSRWVATS